MKNYFGILALAVLVLLPDLASAQRRDESFSRRVNLNLRDRDTLDILREVGIGGRYDGRVVRSVSVVASANRGRSEVELVINNRRVDYGNVDYSERNIGFRLGRDIILGDEIRRMDLVVRGDVYIRSLTVVLEEQRRPDDRTCSVRNSYTRLTDHREVRSFGECHDFAFEKGDSYCNDLRRGVPGSNPVRLTYSLNGRSEVWIFGCEGVPERP